MQNFLNIHIITTRIHCFFVHIIGDLFWKMCYYLYENNQGSRKERINLSQKRNQICAVLKNIFERKTRHLPRPTSPLRPRQKTLKEESKVIMQRYTTLPFTGHMYRCILRSALLWC